MLLGCIADDFTGATDLANTLVKGGMNTVQSIGVPGPAMDVARSVAPLSSSVESRPRSMFIVPE